METKKMHEGNNKLLAYFIGAENNKTALPLTARNLRNDELWLPYFGVVNIKHLKFDSDWNWIMKVVDKIESLTFKGLSFTVDIMHGVTSINCYGVTYIDNLPFESDTVLLHVEKKCKITATYEACIEFIKWYNLNK